MNEFIGILLLLVGVGFGSAGLLTYTVKVERELDNDV